MATKYFDRNGTTSGFGTLTGTWDTSTASWSDDSTGVAAPAIYTFSNTDTASFGSPSVSSTAGTVTVTTPVTINKIQLQNLSGNQTITSSGVGKIIFDGDNPTINTLDTNLGTTISAYVEGTKGINFVGAGQYYWTAISRTDGPTFAFLNTSNIISANDEFPAKISGGSLRVNIGANFEAIKNLNTWQIDQYGCLFFDPASSYTFTNPKKFLGQGYVQVASHSSAVNVVFPAGSSLSGLTGNTDPHGPYTNPGDTGGPYYDPTCGFGLRSSGGGGGAYDFAYATIRDLPTRLTYSTATVSRVTDNRIYFAGPGAQFPNAQINILIWYDTGTSSGSNFVFYANNSDLNPLVIGGGIKCFGLSSTKTFRLYGTSTADNTISGNINPNAKGTLGIFKGDSGKWCLSGDNSYAGTTTISAGTLSARSSTAFGTSGVISQTGGTIELYSTGSLSLNKPTSWSITSASGATSISVPLGQISINPSGVSLNTAATKINVATGATFTLNNTGAISGNGFGIEKNGNGSLTLNYGLNTFTGALTVNGGDLILNSISNTGSSSSWGAGSNAINVPAMLKVTGQGGSTNRTINLSGMTSTINSSGANPITFSSVTQSSGYRVIVLDGTNAGNNTISAPIGNGSAGSSTQIAKNGSGKWKLTGALTYTGITEVNEGTLNIGSISQTFANDVTLSPGTRLESDPGGSCSGTFYCTGAQIYTSLNTFSVTLNGASEISGVLSGNGVVYVSSGTTTIETPSTNTYSGTSTIDSGSVVVAHTLQNPSSSGVGKVFGNSALSVNGTLKTGSSANQQGKARYGGNISFGSGAQIHIGGA